MVVVHDCPLDHTVVERISRNSWHFSLLLLHKEEKLEVSAPCHPSQAAWLLRIWQGFYYGDKEFDVVASFVTFI